MNVITRTQLLALANLLDQATKSTFTNPAPKISTGGYANVLSQMQPDGSEQVIQYASRALTGTGRKYSTREKDTIVWAVDYFGLYIRCPF
jgi:hypothetical protein